MAWQRGLGWLDRRSVQASCAVIMGLAGGCGALAQPANGIDIIHAKQRDDITYLQEVCSGQRPAAHPNVKNSACNVLKDKTAAQSTDCSTLVQRFEAAPKTSERDTNALMLQFDRCAMHKAFFETAAWYGSGAVMDDFDDAKLNAAVASYAASHVGPAFLPHSDASRGGYAMRHLSNWLVQHKHLEHCAVLAKAVDGAAEPVRAWAIPYFKATQCAAATGATASLLTSQNPEFRLWACQGLGAYGTAAAEGKLKAVAETDGFSEIREETVNGRLYATKQFPIRIACAQAFGQVQVRAK
jgi:hypothetical protein